MGKSSINGPFSVAMLNNKRVLPVLIRFRLGFSTKQTIQLLGIPHDYGNPSSAWSVDLRGYPTRLQQKKTSMKPTISAHPKSILGVFSNISLHNLKQGTLRNRSFGDDSPY